MFWMGGTRRAFLAACTMAGVSVAMSSEARSANESLAREAFIWGMPLVLMNRSLDVSLKAGLPLNQFYITAELAIPEYRQVGPNIDTLMGHAWLDLTQGPQVIGVPDTAGRYYSIQLQDMYMNNFAYLGRRTTGTQAGFFAITPPGFEGELPEGITQVRATTTRVLAYVRTMLIGPEDLEAALSVHTAYTLGPLSAFPGSRTTPIARADRARLFPHVDFSNAGAGFFDELDQLVGIYPPLEFDAPSLARFAPLGIGVPGPVAHGTIGDDRLAAAVTSGYDLVKSSIHLTWVNGWARRDNVPPFYHDPVQRAANNMFGKGTHLSDEAVYWGTRQGGVGEWLSGSNRYRLRFAPGETPPVDAFWSLTLYDKDYVLFDNPHGRYGILDRTEGLEYGADGSLEMLIQADEPEQGTANWLPCPRGEFQMILRAYQPRPETLDGTYLPPPFEIV